MPGIRRIGPQGPHQAAGSCHKGPSGASTRSGWKQPKLAKNRRGLPVSRSKGQAWANRGRSGSHFALTVESWPPNHGLAFGSRTGYPRFLDRKTIPQRAIAAPAVETHYRPAERCDDARGGAGRSCVDRGTRDGLTMTGDQGKGTSGTGADVKDSRRDRLKLALRENLKRRKSQARGRSDTGASSENAETVLDDGSGEKPES
jgi:hypothetical protein